MDKVQTLDKAKEIISGDRFREYGAPKDNFAIIAGLWSQILKKDISLTQVTLCLIALKMSRLIHKEDHEDSFVDIAGYAACGNEIVNQGK